MTIPHPREYARRSAGDREHGRGHRHIVDEALFRSIVIRERKRADRSNQPFVLLLMDGAAGPAAEASWIWEAAIEAAAASGRDGDVLGWFTQGAVFGVIRPEIPAADPATAGRTLGARVRRELAKRLDATAAGTVALRLHVYPPPARTGEECGWPGGPWFYPERRGNDVRRMVHDGIKRGLDVVGSLTLLLALSPLILLIAALIKVQSPGPALYGQVRIGHMMKPFTMLKFRTMHVGADPTLHREFVSAFIKGQGRIPEATQNGVFKLANDPRVTRLGRLLRKTSLDELPQLWNVLRGDMSLVGPRPPLPYELEHYKPWHRRRVLEARPGITGLWQVSGRSRTTFDEMVRLDLRYARNRSLWTDLKILLATPAAVISGKGAW